MENKRIRRNLSPREVEILKAVVNGKLYREIACDFNISPRTVEVHIQNIKHKTSCYSLSELRCNYEALTNQANNN